MRPPDDIIVLAIRALSGEVTENMREIAFRCREDIANFRFYFENEPSEIERENAEVMAANFESGYPRKLRSLDIQFIVTREDFGSLDHLDFILYRRHEN